MPTKRPRFVITLNDEIAVFVNHQSRCQKTSISKVIMDLIEEAMDLREDYELSRIAHESEKRCEGLPTISANEVFRECGLA